MYTVSYNAAIYSIIIIKHLAVKNHLPAIFISLSIINFNYWTICFCWLLHILDNSLEVFLSVKWVITVKIYSIIILYVFKFSMDKAFIWKTLNNKT